MTSLFIERTGQVDVLDLRGDVLSDPKTPTHSSSALATLMISSVSQSIETNYGIV
jgi:hypothetical protein